jgi:hypothetical protein
MPFTVSHIVAVIPLYKKFGKYLSLSGLIMGSMAPDFEFFLRITLYGIWGHTVKGIFLFDLPISLILITVFHLWVRDTLLIFLPSQITARFLKYRGFDWMSYMRKNFLKVVFSVLLGIFTHFCWDNFTHEPDYVSPFYFETLNNTLKFGAVKIKFYSFLQILSSIFGLAWFLFALLLGSNCRKIVKEITHQRKFWISLVLLTLLLIGIRYLISLPNEKHFEHFVVVTIGSFIYALVVLSIIKTKFNENNC